MRKVHCYIEVEGDPLCKREHLMRELKCSCGYESIASATRIKKKLQTRFYPVYVRRGDCPEFQKVQRECEASLLTPTKGGGKA